MLGNLHAQHALGDDKRVNHMADRRSLNAWLGQMATRLRLLGPGGLRGPHGEQIWGTWQEGQMVVYSS